MRKAHMEAMGAYLPQDRRRALARSTPLPDRASGTLLFADISGFTHLTEALAQALGPRRGAEELTSQLNHVYDVLIDAVQRFGGSVIHFAGDAITCWFDDTVGAAAQRATACALALQHAMQTFTLVSLPDASTITLTLKIALASGPIRRWVVGDPAVQLLDVVAGAPLARMAAGEQLAQPGEVLLDAATAATLGDAIQLAGWRADASTGEQFAVLQMMHDAARRSAADVVEPESYDTNDVLPEHFSPWLLLPIYERHLAGLGAFLIELRPAVVLFARFAVIDYDGDAAAGAQFDTFICRVQAIVARYDGTLLQVTIGDKGSYLYTAFGAPHAHEDDARRAALAALDLHTLPSTLAFLQPLQIGLSSGVMRAGTYGSAQRLTYGVLGDATNIAARLMKHAAPGETLASAVVQHATATTFTWVAQPLLQLKGKAEPVPVWTLRGPQAAQTMRHQEPRYALPLVGRHHELAQIEATMQQVLNGQGHVIGICAEAGVGKSRLVAEVIRRAQTRGFTAYGGECQSYGTNSAYLLWQPIWRAFFGLDPTATTEQQIETLHAAIQRLAPERLAALPLLDLILDLPLPPNDFTSTLIPQFQKSARESLLLDCMRARAQAARQAGSALLLVLEDLHWIDALSHDLLEIIARAVADLPVLIVSAYRPPDLLRLHAPRVEALPHFTPIPLDTLSASEAKQLIMMKVVQPETVQAESIRDFSAKIVARTQGNPFYIEEVLNYVRDRGGDPTDSAAIAALDLPTSLHSLVLSRIDQLSHHQQVILKAASIIGRTFRVAWLHGYSPYVSTLEQLKTNLAQLAQLELTFVEHPEPNLAYLFKHVVTQEVTYESLPFATRAMLHERLAQYILQEAGGDEEGFLDLLAFHYDRSANMPKRRAYLRRAGEAAAARYANDAAVDYFSRALALSPEDDLIERYALLRAREQLHDIRGERAAQWADLQALDALAAALDDDAWRAEVALRWSAYYESISDFAAAGAAAQRALEHAPDGVAWEADARMRWGRALWRQADYVGARVQLEPALEYARAAGDQRIEIDILHNLGWVMQDQGDIVAARAYHEQALATTRALSDRHGEANALESLGGIADLQGDIPAARMALEQALAIARAIGDRYSEAYVLSNLAANACARGDYQMACQQHAQALTIFCTIDNRHGEALSLDNMGVIASIQGDYEGAYMHHAQALAIFCEIGHRYGESYALAGLGHVLTEMGRLTESVAAWCEAIARCRMLGRASLLAEDWAGLARALLLLGDLPGAQAQIEQVLAYLKHGNLDSAAAPMRAYLNCVAVLRAGNDPRAEPLLERAYTELQAKAARMDAASQHVFLEQVPDNAAILAAWKDT